MSKQNQDRGPAGDGLSPEKITETMADPAFTPEQLPGLWQQIVEPDKSPYCPDGWESGIEAMYRRCETYSQYAILTIVLSEIPFMAWHQTDLIIDQADDLRRRATPEQLLQALVFEQQHRGHWWTASDHILDDATAEQLSGPVIEQIPWYDEFAERGTLPEDEIPEDDVIGHARCRHIVEHIQKRLLGGDSNAWTVFCGIADNGTVIGETAELAATIEQQNRPSRSRT